MECGEENALRHAAAPEISPSLKDGNDRGEELVMSEIHLGCPPNHSGPHISHFTISLPPHHGEEVLGNCVKNIHLNAGIFHQKASVYVRELDWNHQWPPSVIENSPSGQSYGWSVSEVEELHKASLLLAADVIYSDDLTDAFFRVLEAIMSNIPEKVLYLALEKRYNFTIDDLDVVANGYSHFRSYLKDGEEAADLETERSCSFTGQLINLEEIPQYVQEYDRGNDVEIWQIRYAKPKP
ncbi:UNVERIFIED_CONTAM: Methyltransferase-like protein 22 [Sesamum radiatum]|uniref:Methyltransferase-like protein 22 n=1 Tax=Sesamum radiatum TaxID=300843 RepID=A0AAW2WJJ6_SESRA